jgi:hypothetical protein
MLRSMGSRFLALAVIVTPTLALAAPSFTISGARDYILVKRANSAGSWRYNAYGFTGTVLDSVNTDTGESQSEVLSGQLIAAGAENYLARKVAVGVLMKTFAETDFSLVWIINRDTGARSLLRLPKSGMPSPAYGSSYSFRSILSMFYSTGGYLNVVQGDATGSQARLRFGPNLNFLDCRAVLTVETDPCREFH